VKFMQEHADKPYFDQAPLTNVLEGSISAAPAQVFNYAAYLPDGLVRPDQISRALQGWVRKNPDGVGHWLKTHPDSKIYNQVASEYAASIRAIDPEAAKAWQDTIKPSVGAK
jgi:hypothetical protein